MLSDRTGIWIIRMVESVLVRIVAEAAVDLLVRIKQFKEATPDSPG